MMGADGGELWARLKQAGLVEGDAPAMQAQLTPWYVRAMLGIAGWIGAMFLLGFVGAGFAFVMKSAASALIVGALLCAAATVMFRGRPDGDFIGQFALAISIAGQVLIAMGLGQLVRDEIALIAIAFAAVEVGLFLLIANFLHRVLSAVAASAALLLALGIWGFYPYTQAIVFAAFSWAWLHEFSVPGRSAEIRAIGYGLTLLTIAELVTRSTTSYLRAEWPSHGAMAPIGGPFGFWIGAALVGAVAIWVLWKLLVRQGVATAQGPGLAALAGGALVGLISVKAPGLGVTVTMLLLGYANGNRLLAGLGIVSLLAYWSYYYYSLDITLLQKSTVLLCAGIALIAARLAVNHRWPASAEKGARHA